MHHQIRTIVDTPHTGVVLVTQYMDREAYVVKPQTQSTQEFNGVQSDNFWDVVPWWPS